MSVIDIASLLNGCGLLKRSDKAEVLMNNEVKKVLDEMRDRSDTVIGGRAITMRNFVSQEKCEEWANRLETAMKNDIEMQTSSILKGFVISLIRNHYELNEAVIEKCSVDMFKYTCDEISKWFEEHGDWQLASYVRVLDGDDNDVFVPQ